MEDVMILTIGMIVKNEEKYLDECLAAIKPILDSLDSELIIVDTGSTDRTVEIAKNYTNKLYHFEWCNDFSAARNVTIDRAKGEWYLFIDADEILKDASEIIEFFKSKEYKNYMSTAYYISNYNKTQKSASSSILMPRMRKMTSKTRFSGIVHEQLPIFLPVKNLTKTEFMHYGYYLNTPKQAKVKSKRNVDLLLAQLDTIDDSSKFRRELGEAYMLYDIVKNREKALKHYKIGRELASKENNNNYCVISINLITQYILMGLFLEAISEAELYFKSKSDSLASDTDVYFLLLQAYSPINSHKSIIDNYAKYVDNFNKYKDNKIITREVYYRALFSVNRYFFYKASMYAINSHIKLEQYYEAYNLIRDVLILSCEFAENQDLLFKHYLEIMRLKNDYSDLLYLYNLDVEKNEEYYTNLEKVIETFISENIEEKNKIVSLILNIGDTESTYTIYMQIRKSFSVNLIISEDMITTFLNSIKKLEIYHYDILYYILKNNISLKIFKGKFDTSLLSSYFKLLYNQYDDFIDTIHNYAYESITPYEAYIIKNIYELVFIFDVNDSNNNYELVMDFLNRYTKVFNLYLTYTYTEDSIDEVNIELLPQDIKFGYYYMKASEALLNNDELKYIRLLRKALDSNNAMKDLISLLIDNTTEKNEENNPDAMSEFEMLALTVKNNIKDLIKSNQLEDAKAILSEYKLLNPTDKEIPALEGKLI
jgi:glycosyltransferase involved in cell wall biosynthesis